VAAAFRAAAFLSVALACVGVTSAPAADAPPGAASCSGCHPARANADTPVPRLAGKDADSIVAAMQAFRGGQRSATVMDRIAKGFSDGETKAIAAWLVIQH
jgi:cytochrome subunit of sulfide dehydrogenase